MELDLLSVLGGSGATGGLAILYLRQLYARQKLENGELKTEVAELRQEIHQQVNARLSAAATEKDLSKLEDEVRELKRAQDTLAKTVNMPLLNQQIQHLSIGVGELTSKLESFMVRSAEMGVEVNNLKGYIGNVSGQVKQLKEEFNGKKGRV